MKTGKLTPLLVLVFVVSVVYIPYSAYSQEQEPAAKDAPKTLRVNALRDEEDKLTGRIYKYSAFLDGRVVFKDSSEVEAKLNYHQVFGQILFINGKGDTMALANPATTLMVVISNDTFYFHDKFFLQKLTQYDENNLAVRQTIKYVGREKAGPYGSYSSTSAANSNSTVTTDDQITQYISLDENVVYTIKNEYYFADRFNNFFRASKKSFYNLFSKHEKALKEYVKQNPVDFNKKDDLLRVIQFANQLK